MTATPRPTTIVLHCTSGLPPHLAALVEGFMRDGVGWVCVVGPSCAMIETFIDELVVGEGRRDSPMTTTSHQDETLADVIEFANTLNLIGTGGAVRVIEA